MLDISSAGKVTVGKTTVGKVTVGKTTVGEAKVVYYYKYHSTPQLQGNAIKPLINFHSLM